MSVPFTKSELELIAKNAEAGNMLGPGETQALVAEVRRLELASLGMFDPVKVGQVVAQLQMERDEAIAAARELLACWVPPQHQNDYLKHWGWLKIKREDDER